MRFEQLLDELGIECRRSGHEHCRPGWLQLDCPFCSKDWKHFRLGYNIAKRYAHCWSCGHHRVPNVLAEITGEPLSKFIRLFGEVESFQFKERRAEGKLVLPRGICDLKKAHKDYLISRGYDPDSLTKKWGIKGTSFDAPMPWRIFIPIIHRGEIVSWTTRRIVDEHKERYHAAGLEQEKIHRSELLYGEDYCIHHTVIVVEGPFDVWRIGEGAVATMTTSYSRAQLRRIAKYPRRVILFDSEPAAQRRASRLMDDLKVFPGETFGIVLNAKDPSSASEQEIEEIRSRFLR